MRRLCALVIAALALGVAVAAAPASAAPKPRVTVIGDSVQASFSFVPAATARLGKGLDLKLDAVVCRRLVAPSCSYNGVTPLTALQLIRSSTGAKLGKVVVVHVGYNDDASVYDINAVMKALRAKGVTVDPAKVPGGFGYLRGPDGVMIENAQSGNVERFNHVHMYHEHPACAMQWYVAHLGAQMPAGGRGGASRGDAPTGPMPGTSSDCTNPKTVYSPPTFPSFAKGGFVRDPAGGVLLDDISISIRPWPGGGLASTRGRLYDHWAVSTANLDQTVARLKSENVKFLEEIHPWGSSRAAMIEGPDRIAIEIVEVK